MSDKYAQERVADVKTDRCPLCDANIIAEYDWKIIENKYPWDAVALQHDMIVPKEHLQEKELSSAAVDELYRLKYEVLNTKYVFITEALPGSKSVPGHFHLHLIVPKVID